MESVFLLWHVREVEGGDDDELFIGVYSSEQRQPLLLSALGANPVSLTSPEDSRFILAS